VIQHRRLLWVLTSKADDGPFAVWPKNVLPVDSGQVSIRSDGILLHDLRRRPRAGCGNRLVPSIRRLHHPPRTAQQPGARSRPRHDPRRESGKRHRPPSGAVCCPKVRYAKAALPKGTPGKDRRAFLPSNDDQSRQSDRAYRKNRPHAPEFDLWLQGSAGKTVRVISSSRSGAAPLCPSVEKRRRAYRYDQRFGPSANCMRQAKVGK